jgi:undecaprenyl-phosphate galactose phosphotransferase
MIILQFAFYFLINKYFKVHDRIMYNTFFIYLVLNLVKNMYSFRTILVWEELKNQLKVHIEYLCVMLINDIAFWGSRYIKVHLIIGVSFTFFNLMILWLTRKVFEKELRKNLIIIGIGQTAMRLTKVIRQNSFIMYNLLGYIDVNEIQGINQISRIEDSLILGKYHDIERILSERDVKEVIIAMPLADNKQMNEIIDKLDGKVNKVKFIPEFNGEYTFNSSIEDYDGLMVISSYNGINIPGDKLIKRFFDIIGGLVGLLVVGVVALIYGRKIKADGGSLFFKHKRVGKDLKPFEMYKFRSMYVDAELRLDDLLSSDEQLKEEFYKNFKLKEDPRITEVGKFLRESSLDEIPQFINVLKGEMSLVGPRPVVQKELELYYGKERSKKIFMIKPGITGMWQVNGRSDVDHYEDRIALDLYYLRNWTLWLDIVILFKTVVATLKRKGAY